MRTPAILRSLARSPGLCAAVVLTLAVGIAALTTTFAVVNAALVRQPPFPDADRLALLFLERNPRGEAPRRERWSFPRFQRLRAEQRSFEQVASYSPATLTLSGGAEAEMVHAERVSASYFTTLGVRPARGRLFTEAEDAPGNPTPVVVLSHDIWTRRWAADPAIIGRPIRLNGVTFTVIGVLPRGFGGLTARVDAWLPRTMSPLVTYAEYLTTNQNFIGAVGRLRSGVDLTTARAELAVLGADINRALPSDPRFPEERVTATAISLNEARVDGTVRRSLFVLLAGVALLHLLACANVINLLLGRVASRRRESAVRLALGSSPRRLFGQTFMEGFGPSVLGGALGLMIAWRLTLMIAPAAGVWAPRNFVRAIAPFDTPAFGSVELAIGAAMTLATAALVASLAALGSLGIDVPSGIRAGSRGLSHGAITLRRPTARGLVVAAEAALAMLLLVAAGLLIDSFQRMRQTTIGVDPTNVLTFWTIPSEARVPVAAAPAYVGRLLEAISRVPGVRNVSVDGGAPLAGTASSVLYIQGRPTPGPGEAPPVLRHYVAADHFRTLGIPLRRGRVFGAADVAGAPHVTVISESAARRFWPNEDPIGRRVWFGSGSSFNSPDSSAEIVGIVGDVVYAPVDQSPNPASFYTPYQQFTYASRMFFLRTEHDPMSVVSDVRKAIASVDPELAMREVQPLTHVVEGSWARHRFNARLFGAFGVLALLLAASGVYAVLSHAVTDRTREFGIRIALGAQPRSLLGQVVREGVLLPAAGLAVGIVGALAFTRVLQSSLYGVSPRDPRILALTAAVLLVVSVLACLFPAVRATRSDPIEALRSD